MVNKKSYIKVNGVPKLINSYCIFIDALGFSRRIEDAKNIQDEQLLLAHYYNSFVRYYKLFFKTKMSEIQIWDSKIFSDNFLLGCPANIENFQKGENEFGLVILSLAGFQLSLIHDDILVRGGWAYGSLYIDENIIYGKSLLESYRLEMTAKFPIIILSKEMLNLVNSHLKFYIDLESSPHYNDLLQFEDKIFINYLNAGNQDEHLNETVYVDHKDFIQRNIRKYEASEEILNKYLWLASYHDYYIDEFLGTSYNRLKINFVSHYQFSRIQRTNGIK